MKFQTIEVEIAGRTARITLDRPPLNILDVPMMQEIAGSLDRLPPPVEFVVFAGTGERGFSAGAEIRDHAPERAAKMLGAFHGIIRRLAASDWITVSAVHGICLGGGCELATFCDFAIAEESATFGQPEIKLGCFPPVAVVTFPRLIGPRAAAEMILTGRTIGAEEARELGLVSRVVPGGEARNAASRLVEELSSLSASALRLARQALGQFRGPEFDAALREAEEIYVKRLLQTGDAAEGVRAFIEKRAPVWQGRQARMR
ncbi:MAG TPA: enoyl-CoA hydratase-related protein [Verrucomicrobiae bacterium]|nr:enoyl-CoA hydratase-related protein [Verrucomicrobiae bacterium]